MQQDPPQTLRIEYWDSIRGLAALQVVLLHCVSAFAPGLATSAVSAGTLAAYVRASPLFFLYDGYSAVYLFFILSGFVLTRSFEYASSGSVGTVLARYVRLALPAFAACVFSATMYLWFQNSHLVTGAAVDSKWMMNLWHPEMTFSHLVMDGALNSAILGYRESGPFPSGTTFQDSIGDAFVFPLWTLSWEFYGSILTLLLVKADRFRRGTGVLIGFGLLLFLSRSSLICFLTGYLAAQFLSDERPKIASFGAWALMLAGVSVCVVAENWQPAWLIEFCGSGIGDWLPFPGNDAYHLQKICGATAIFLAVTQLDWLKRRLSSAPIIGLSGLSFPLYLMHMPIIFGPACAVFNGTASLTNVAIARPVAIAFAIVISVPAALLFRSVDRLAIGLSSALRRAC